MESHDFGLSESNFSMSKRSQVTRANSKTKMQKEPGQKKEFYAFQGAKFTSYTGDQIDDYEDDEF